MDVHFRDLNPFFLSEQGRCTGPAGAESMLRLASVLVFWVLGSALAHASVIHDFTGPVGSFEYESAGFISGDLIVPVAALNSCSIASSAPCEELRFFPSGRTLFSSTGATSFDCLSIGAGAFTRATARVAAAPISCRRQRQNSKP
jgi:hypothetical protein